MKKKIQWAFGITLLILSVIGTIKPIATGGIVYSIIFPSFMFSIISFVSEISEACSGIAHDTFEKAYKTANQSHDKVQKDLAAYEAGEYNIPYITDAVPKEIYNELLKSKDFLRASAISQEMSIIFDRCIKRCDIVTLICYVLLFMSLIFATNIARWLAWVDLNCISLWSLTLLFFTLELKEEIRKKVYMYILKKAEKNVDKKKHAQN